VQVEDITNQKNSDNEEDEEQNHVEMVGPSTGKTDTREKHVTPRTPSKQKELTLSVPKIPEGVKVLDHMLGCVTKLKYVDNDVVYREKFPDFVQ
jgi:hypothetical protein